MVIKVRIDRGKCVVAHFCLFYAPTIFTPTLPDSKPAVMEALRVDGKLDEGVIPDSLYEAAKEAERHCPSGAIKVYKE